MAEWTDRLTQRITTTLQNPQPQTIRATEIKHPPIFILGHFRSGTTRLHELMSKDDRLVAPTVYQCFAPRVFLHREEAISAQFGRLQLRRPMDSVKVKVRSTAAFLGLGVLGVASAWDDQPTNQPTKHRTQPTPNQPTNHPPTR